jgi:hypothetical protein
MSLSGNELILLLAATAPTLSLDGDGFLASLVASDNGEYDVNIMADSPAKTINTVSQYRRLAFLVLMEPSLVITDALGKSRAYFWLKAILSLPRDLRACF